MHFQPSQTTQNVKFDDSEKESGTVLGQTTVGGGFIVQEARITVLLPFSSVANSNGGTTNGFTGMFAGGAFMQVGSGEVTPASRKEQLPCVLLI